MPSLFIFFVEKVHVVALSDVTLNCYHIEDIIIYNRQQDRVKMTLISPSLSLTLFLTSLCGGLTRSATLKMNHSNDGD